MTNPLLAHVRTIRSTVSGEYTSTTRLVDAALDLRLMAADDAEVVAVLDGVLAEVGSYTITANEWWLGKLEELESLARRDDRNQLAAG